MVENIDRGEVVFVITSGAIVVVVVVLFSTVDNCGLNLLFLCWLSNKLTLSLFLFTNFFFKISVGDFI